MAKKINLADLVFKVSDDGTLKIFEGKAKKAGDATAKLGKKTDETTYATKKGINATANQTKNFANMARGISGSLVPAYATLAANVFALTAVFGFLKGAADYRLLQEGQQNYAVVTGVAYKTLTESIIRATDAQVTYTDAAQAAAIGTAAGLSPEQLEKLGAAAKTVSIALGRDVTDSFNRLVRGVTKAEPELLDELGIILRLEPATKKYAASLDISKDSLNAFQRTQAVTNEVLGQVEQKFNAINAIMDPQTNQINKLNKAFDDLLNTVRLLIAGPAEGLATFFSQNVYAAAGALGLFALPILQSILPAFDEWEKASVAKLAAHDAAVERSKKKIQAYGRLQEMNAAKAKARAQQAGVGLFQLAKGQAAGAAGTGLAQLQAGRTISDAQLRNLKAQATKGIGIFKGMDSKVKASWIKSMTEMNMSTKINITDKVAIHLKKTELNFRAAGLRIKAAWSSAMAGVQKASRVAAGVVSKAFGFLTGISIAILAFEGIKAGLEKFGFLGGKVRETDDSMKGLIKRQQDFNKELDMMLGKEKQISGAGIERTFNELLKANANQLAGAQIGKVLQDIQDRTPVRPGSLAGDATLGGPSGKTIRQNYSTVEDRSFTGLSITKRVAGEVRDATEAELAYFDSLADVNKLEGELMGTIEKLAGKFPELSVLVGEKLPKDFEGLNQGAKDFIVSTILAGDAVKYLEQSSSTADETLRSLTGKTSPALTALKVLEEQRDAYAAIMAAPGFVDDADSTTTKAFNKFKGLAAKQRGKIDTSQQLTNLKALNQVKSQGISNTILGQTKLGKLAQTNLKISEKQVEIDAKKAEIALTRKLIELEQGNQEDMENRLQKETKALQLLEGQKTGLQNSINLTRQLGVVAVNTFENSMIKGIEGVIQGTMSVKDAFKSMAQSILVSLSQVLAKMLAMKVMTAMFPGFAMADGGIIPMAKGGITGYRNGGIATEPTYLVGEGKHNEAVVPLPDGRSIPVNMKGNGGNNNIVINVDAGGNSNSTGGNAEQGKALGMAIQMAVMETIQREKRPGGVLS
jgi:hypothetical protein